MLDNDLSTPLERLFGFAAAASAAINLAFDGDECDPGLVEASCSCARIVLGYGEIRAASAIL